MRATTYTIEGPRPTLYIDGQLVEYTDLLFEPAVFFYINFITPCPTIPKWRIVLATGEVINVSTEDIKFTIVDGQPLRIDLGIG